MKKLVIPSPVTLPPLSTDIPGREYYFADFVGEFLLMNEHMRSDDKLEHLFVLEDLLSKSAGDEVELGDEVLVAAKDAAKALIDERMNANRLPGPWAMKVLRHYHVLVAAAK